MAARVPFHKNTNLKPHQTNLSDANEADDDHNIFPFYFLIMMPNTIGSFARAYHYNDYSLALLGLLVLITFLLLECSLFRFRSVPKNENPCQKFWFKITLWFLYTAISCGFVHQFGYLLSLQITVALYIVVLVCSGLMLYTFIILDRVSTGSTYENEIGLQEKSMLCVDKSNYVDSVFAKV
ncbi:hypothetical protein CTI12_AA181950 [Artemisia annua]|uniref:Uncharacterized protein n=1 Tax=Artemisia annua TaxID=35608 RepID=A0A2U1P8A8_ARTAN|nr:hypothetical protein CTI12_AA181950 [Artemisia annua]